ncbi:MAG: DUF4321 domain-containing protein [Tissierellia bacterium]|nr:DUF4321 domain-containing protein [Tissierellia bacterium]MDD4781475.1 DUF4321 domain-containing protein [Tissierellia bacterium]
MKKGSSTYLVLLIIIGSVIGSILGKAFSNILPILNYGETIGFGPTTLDLNIITFTLGLSANLTVSGIIGIIIAIIAYRKF